MRLPPISSLAPLATAASTWVNSCTSAASLDRGPSVVFSSIGSPALSALSAAWNSFEELVGDGFDHDEALGGAAGLAGVVHPAPDRPGDGVVEVGVFQHDEGVAAAELHGGDLEVPAGARGDALARGDAAGQADALDAGVVDDLVGLLMGDEQVGVEADRRAGVEQQLLECDRALRHDAGVLHHQRIAGHQVRAGDARELVIGEVPGLDAEDHADRAALHVRLALVGLSLTGARKRSAFLA